MNSLSGKAGLAALALLLNGGWCIANPIENPSFELESSSSYNHAMFWHMNNPDDHGDAYGSASRENWRAHGGQFVGAIRGAWAGLGDYGGFWREAEGRGGRTFVASAWFYADLTWSARTQQLKLEFWNWDRTQMLGSAINNLADLREEWTRHEVSAVSPEGTEWVRIVIHADGTGEAGSLQVDDVELSTAP